MGEAQAKAKALLAKHPFCCFCGGAERAATIDHQPARALFDQKQWPEGYVFPACYACNQESRRHENVLAVLVRINTDNQGFTDVRRNELQRYIRAMNNNFPDLLRILTSNEKRHYFRAERLQRLGGVGLSNLPMVGIGSDLADESVNSVMRKLLKALHYKHTGYILPRSGSIALDWITNAYLHTLREDHEFIGSLTGVPTVTRNGTDLSSQFSYRYGIDLEKLVSAFVIVFRNSLVGIGIVAHDEKVFQCEADQAN